MEPVSGLRPTAWVATTWARFASDGSGGESTVLSSKEGALEVTDWSLNGRLLLYKIERPDSASILALPLSPERRPQGVLETRAEEMQGQFTPEQRMDGLHIKRVRFARGVQFVHFLTPGLHQWQVSVHGGAPPQAAGREGDFSTWRSTAD